MASAHWEEILSATLLQTSNTYLVGSPDRATLTIANSDQPVFTTVISNLHLPVGIDYHSPSNLLIVSLNFDTGLPFNFIQVRTNDATTNWTTISNMTGEINLACARSTNGGWTVGDLYFNTGEGGQIGRVPDTTNSFTTNWITLADSVVQGRGRERARRTSARCCSCHSWPAPLRRGPARRR